MISTRCSKQPTGPSTTPRTAIATSSAILASPEPTAPGPREVERKQPERGELSHEEQLKIRQEYFRSRVARCPRDEALLDVEDVTAMGQSTRSLMVSCPLCGLSAELD